MRFDASFTTEVAGSTRVCQELIVITASEFTTRSNYGVVELVQTYRTAQGEGRSGHGVNAAVELSNN
jgi:hypothetical protein